MRSEETPERGYYGTGYGQGGQYPALLVLKTVSDVSVVKKGLNPVLVQREMECGHSPLVRIARVSAGRGAGSSQRLRARGSRDGNCNWLQKDIRVGYNSAPGRPDTDIDALSLGSALGLAAEAHAGSEGNWLGKKEP